MDLKNFLIISFTMERETISSTNQNQSKTLDKIISEKET